MSPRINLHLKPFIVPDFVIVETPPGTRQEGFKAVPSLPLIDLSAQVLNQLCDDFRDAIFTKAFKNKDGSEKAAAAMRMLKDVFAADPDYAHSWHCNVAMSLYDSMESPNHVTANEGASRFMKLAFDVITKA